MPFNLTISTENAAFEDLGGEVARVLRDTAKRIEGYATYPTFPSGGTLKDVNGNTVGFFTFRGERQRRDA